MTFPDRMRAAGVASGIHLVSSCLLAVLASALVFLVWYPYPYRELSGGKALFFLIISVDIVCGPLLTLVLFNPEKPKAELWRDMALVVAIQLAALGYGVHTVWQARPLYLVQEVDRFKVIAAPDVPASELAQLAAKLQPHVWSGPMVVAIRPPRDAEEQQKVMFEALQGGRDYAERPDFYLPYNGAAALKSLNRAKPLAVFLQKQPGQLEVAQKLAREKGTDMALWLYLPVVARQDWVAVLDRQGQIQGFLKGDGF